MAITSDGQKKRRGTGGDFCRNLRHCYGNAGIFWVVLIQRRDLPNIPLRFSTE